MGDTSKIPCLHKMKEWARKKLEKNIYHFGLRGLDHYKLTEQNQSLKLSPVRLHFNVGGEFLCCQMHVYTV